MDNERVPVHVLVEGKPRIVMMRKTLYDNIKRLAKLNKAVELLTTIVQAYETGTPCLDPDRMVMDTSWLPAVTEFLRAAKRE